MEKQLAKQIARDVEDRLSKTKINYLTAPLMREYINGVLLENGLEEVRHRLTRLGTPPFEVEQYFKNAIFNPEHFINKLGSETSEQYLLLNLLPKNLADLYLTSEIILLNLNYWSLRPLSFYINTRSILEGIIDDKSDQKLVALKLYQVLKSLSPFFSGDLVLGNFNSVFLSQFKNSAELSYILNLLHPLFLEINSRMDDLKPHLTLEFSSLDDNQNENPKLPIEETFKTYFNIRNHYIKENYNQINPTILYDYSCRNLTENQNIIILKKYSLNLDSNLIFYNGNTSKILNSFWVNFNRFNKDKLDCNKIILDKILINLHKISLNSEKEDEIFYDILAERLEQVFDFFKYKKQYVSNKLDSLSCWNRLSSKIFKFESPRLLDNAIKSISFIGLNEAVGYHCGIELDRIETSEKFALNILSNMKKVIEEKNNIDNENFILTQPHDDNYIYLFNKNSQICDASKPYHYNSSIIRQNSNLLLTEKIQIFKKFENLLEGGSIFRVENDNYENNFINLFTSLSKANLNAFLINKRIEEL
jgi:hypothetical protein